MTDPLRTLEAFAAQHPDLRVPHPLECLNLSVGTACSLACRFCAHARSHIPRRSMPTPLFCSLVDRAVQFGHRTFNLTPILGEVLLDPGFLDKLAYVDAHPGVKFYFFSSNLTHADDRFWATLAGLRKLRWFSISLYGLNAKDYTRVTGAPAAVHDTVLANLERLIEIESLAGRCEIKVRGPGPRSAAPPSPRCAELLDHLQDQGFQVRRGVRIMNWGGVVHKRDVADLDVEFKPIDRERTLPCVFLFHKPTVLPDGAVNACSCGDAHAQLTIGSLADQRFEDVFSSGNPAYAGLLARHMSGRFGAPCRGCSGYRSLDQPWYSYQYYDRGFISLLEFVEWLSAHTPSTGR